MRSCRSCLKPKAAAEFRGQRPDCRECEREACRRYGAENRQKRNARLSKWRRENPEKASAADRRKALKRNYGLTENDVEAIRVAQGGLCAICGEAKALVIDHSHENGDVRGLLCTRCNTGIGWIEQRPDFINLVCAYLGEPCHADVLLEIANAEATP